MIATRTIIIGRVLAHHYVRVRNCGFPGGFMIYWRGKKDFAQPTEFVTWDELVGAIKHRLALVGLGLVERPTKPTSYITAPLTVMVLRQHRKLRKRAYENHIPPLRNPEAETQKIKK